MRQFSVSILSDQDIECRYGDEPTEEKHGDAVGRAHKCGWEWGEKGINVVRGELTGRLTIIHYYIEDSTEVHDVRLLR